MTLQLRKGDHIWHKGYWYAVTRTLNIRKREIPTHCDIDHAFDRNKKRHASTNKC